jgi:hypothetical protein
MIALGDLVLLVLRLASSTPLFRRGLVLIKIASSRRGALAGTRWAQFNCNDKKVRRLAGEDKLRGDRCTTKGEQDTSRRRTTYKFFRPRVGEHRE